MRLTIKGIEPRETMRHFLQLSYQLICRELNLDTWTEVTYTHRDKKLGKTGEAAIDTEARHPFKMTALPVSPLESLVIYAHELTHVRDFQTGRLKLNKSSDAPCLEYDGKPIDPIVSFISRELGADYLALPYEIEAYRNQWKVSERVLKQMPESAYKFVCEMNPFVESPMEYVTAGIKHQADSEALLASNRLDPSLEEIAKGAMNVDATNTEAVTKMLGIMSIMRSGKRIGAHATSPLMTRKAKA